MKIIEVGGRKTWVVLARYRAFLSKPEVDGIIRVDDFKQACIMQSDGNVGSRGRCVDYRWHVRSFTEIRLFVFLCSVHVLL